MNKIALAALNKRIHARNRRFNKLPKARQRIRIVKDIIEHLDSRKFTAKTGNYLSLHNRYRGASADTQLCEIFEQARCTVCGIGGAFVSAVLLHDDITVDYMGGYFNDSERMKEYLSKWFSNKQLSLIESAFEKTAMTTYKYQDMDKLTAASRFGKLYSNNTSRLKAICENIITNKGIFCPEKDDRVKQDYE